MARRDLEQFKVPGSSNAFYIPNFVSEEEQEYLIRKILESPRHKWKALANRRVFFSGGEVSKNVLIPQAMPSFLTGYPNIIGRLQDTGAFDSSPHCAPNHVILNEYLPGQGIMPHEDGPSYHPVVATISLGSHAVFHYYQYAIESDVSASAGASLQAGRTINPRPVLSVLLEPCSAIVTTSSLYISHLHGIQDIEEDTVSITEDGHAFVAGLESPVANWHMLSPTKAQAMHSGDILRRGTRYSLTCRDVEKVMGGKTFLRQ
ncbi:hypothetical protein FIBSPDRAFT_907000 [Athelia psychrophila]|uniref:Fe2OG dioxygenase domain-containing protein n=1 Tax=Athelia psychrophila TaxID=1759441 RepID=A0A166VZJ9_9AGAM|nr:hypothetical protein FIBSPDRAFT_914892 [Fibularhizoctonia sp. CBS 109695]KZP33224.1 hypothetical protein FIBSPDRAFT_907000 [Fibularhizoctonia sp. CBS 109695]